MTVSEETGLCQRPVSEETKDTRRAYTSRYTSRKTRNKQNNRYAQHSNNTRRAYTSRKTRNKQNNRHAPYSNNTNQNLVSVPNPYNYLEKELKQIMCTDEIYWLKKDIMKQKYLKFHENKSIKIMEIGKILREDDVDIINLQNKLKEICVYRYLEIAESKKYVNQKHYDKKSKENHENFLIRNIKLIINLNANRNIKYVMRELKKIYKGGSDDKHFSKLQFEQKLSILADECNDLELKQQLSMLADGYDGSELEQLRIIMKDVLQEIDEDELN